MGGRRRRCRRDGNGGWQWLPHQLALGEAEELGEPIGATSFRGRMMTRWDKIRDGSALEWLKDICDFFCDFLRPV